MNAITTTFHYPFCPKVGEDFDWTGIIETYDWIQILEETPQDKIHHAEGNVLIHTRMVLEELVALEEWKNLSENDRSVLFLAALMHDIGKPFTTKEEDGRIVAPHHAQKGAKMAQSMLYRGLGFDIPFEQRQAVVRLVRHHGLPLWFWDKPEPEKRLLKTAMGLNLRHLAMLSQADAQGRICQDPEDLQTRIELFREFSQEHNCYETPYVFENDLAKFVYFQKEGSSPLYVPFDDSICTVTLLSGLPGTGKDTWCANEGKDLPVVSLDNIRRKHGIKPTDNQGKVIQMAKEEARQYLRQKKDFIWNATNITRQLRQGLIALFTAYKAKVRIVYLEVDYKTLLARNKTREHQVPYPVLERMINKLEIPSAHEAHEVEFRVAGSELRV